MKGLEVLYLLHENVEYIRDGNARQEERGCETKKGRDERDLILFISVAVGRRAGE